MSEPKERDKVIKREKRQKERVIEAGASTVDAPASIMSKLITGFHRQHPDGALVIGGNLNCDTKTINKWLSANKTLRACGMSRIPLEPHGPQCTRTGKIKKKVGPGKHGKIYSRTTIDHVIASDALAQGI